MHRRIGEPWSAILRAHCKKYNDRIVRAERTPCAGWWRDRNDFDLAGVSPSIAMPRPIPHQRTNGFAEEDALNVAGV